MPAHSILAAISLALLAAAYLAAVVGGFSVKWWWGLGNLLLMPLAILPFSFLHWRVARIAWALVGGALVLFGSAAFLQSVTQLPQQVGEEFGYELTMPKGWYLRTELADHAQVQMSRPLSDLYFVSYFSELESNNEFETAFVNMAAELGMEDPGRMAQCGLFKLDQSPACTTTITTCSEPSCIVYSLTTVQAELAAVHLVGWSTASRVAENLPILESIRDSFEWVEQADIENGG